eukprot:GHVP01047976.1.p1 GENE.GHVP01047976.1~~GHVP01047976.1.p1  ORF type:complete len:145 (+),score=38.15 GHVP01047976.1:181-615(+)
MDISKLNIIGRPDLDVEDKDAAFLVAKNSPEEELRCLDILLTQLEEKNQPLFERVVRCLGVQICEVLLSETKKIIEDDVTVGDEEGQIKSPGGNFLSLIKEKFSREEVKFIWAEQVKQQRNRRRIAQLKKEREERVIRKKNKKK